MTEQENLGFYKKDDPNTEFIELLYPLEEKEEVSQIFQRFEAHLIEDDS